jgi:hypothetical protein
MSGTSEEAAETPQSLVLAKSERADDYALEQALYQVPTRMTRRSFKAPEM